MSRIFLSYRRDDSPGHAGRISDHLAKKFGESNVFMDVDGIDLGRDFKPVLAEAVQKSDAMLVVIGPGWLECQDPATRARRLDQEDDWVRFEIAEALRRDIPVIPVLVRNAPMAEEGAIPADIRGLCTRQATSLSDSQWKADMAYLVVRLKAILRRARWASLKRRAATLGKRPATYAVLIAVVVISGMLIGARSTRDKPFPPAFEEVKSAELLVSDVDDYLRIYINGTELPTIEFGQAPGPIQITRLLHAGSNTLNFGVDNGPYGGCGAKVELRINGQRSGDYAWHWWQDIDKARANANCFTFIKTLYLPSKSAPPPAEQPDASAPEAQCQAVKSTKGDTEARLVFVNERKAAVDIYWVDYDGTTKLFFELGPGGRHSIDTYLTHGWCAKDKTTNRTVGATSVSRSGQSFVIR